MRRQSQEMQISLRKLKWSMYLSGLLCTRVAMACARGSGLKFSSCSAATSWHPLHAASPAETHAHLVSSDALDSIKLLGPRYVHCCGCAHHCGCQGRNASLLLQGVQEVPDEGVIPDEEHSCVDACITSPTSAPS